MWVRADTPVVEVCEAIAERMSAVTSAGGPPGPVPSDAGVDLLRFGDLVDGDVLGPLGSGWANGARSPAASSNDGPRLVWEQVTGFDAGRRVSAAGGARIVGRSGEHWRVRTVGRPVDVDDLRVHRQPVAPTPEVDLGVAPLVDLSPPTPPERPSWLTTLAPFPVAVVMALLFSPMFMIFSLSGVLVAGARWVDGRRRYTRALEQHRRESAAAAARHRAAVDRLAERAARARWSRALVAGRLDDLALRRSPGLWARRHADVGSLLVPLLVGPDRLEVRGHGSLTIEPVPREVDLAVASLGVVGDPTAVRSVLRHLVTALAVASGPSERVLRLVTDRDRRSAWDAAKWLPHLDGGVATDLADAERLAATTPQRSGGARSVVVLDGVEAWRAVGDGVRRRWSTCALVVGAARAEELPASCTSILEVEPDGTCRLTDLTRPDRSPAHGVVMGLSASRAKRIWQALRRWDDPDPAVHEDGGAMLADRVRFDDVLEAPDPESIRATWSAAPLDALPAVLGLGSDGPVTVDLVRDGPHAVVAGTTGAGKSEFLRTWVAAMAIAVPPRDLQFVVVDYKGGGAFDAAERLPHVSAVLTDLDAHLGERALTSLRAELRRREELFREASVGDVADYRRTGRRLARLVVVVDEFATLAAELPEVLDALVDVAQRGRSLGLHLVLATQRPSGVLDAKIKANTELRVALRVQDPADSHDVVGDTSAANLDPRCPGRAVVRTGGGERITLQTAHVSAAARSADAPIRVSAFSLGDDLSEPDESTGVTTLDQIVEATAAAAPSGLVHRPWLPPLPAEWIVPGGASDPVAAGPVLVWESADEHQNGPAAFVAVADEPDRQRRVPVRWSPADGHVVVHGRSTETTSATLAALATAAAEDLGAAVYPLSSGREGMGQRLRAQPWAATSIAAGDVELVGRLVDHLTSELRRRAELGPSGCTQDEQRPWVLAVDGLDDLVDTLTEAGRHGLLTRLVDVLRDGPRHGIAAVMSVRSDRGVPIRLQPSLALRFAHELADPSSLLALGLRPASTPTLVGRQAVDVVTGRHVVMVDRVGPDPARPSMTVGADVAGDADTAASVVAPPVPVLPDVVAALDVGSAARPDRSGWCVPVGLAVSGLEVADLRLDTRVLIAGRRGSGRTWLSRSIAQRLVAGGAQVVGVSRDRGLRACSTHGIDVDGTPPSDRPSECSTSVWVLDDVDELSDEWVSWLAPLADSSQPVLVTGRPGSFASRVGSAWWGAWRQSPSVVLLDPRPNDATALGIQLPTRIGPRHLPGRAAVVEDGIVEMVQLAVPFRVRESVDGPIDPIARSARPVTRRPAERDARGA